MSDIQANVLQSHPFGQFSMDELTKQETMQERLVAKRKKAEKRHLQRLSSRYNEALKEKNPYISQLVIYALFFVFFVSNTRHNGNQKHTPKKHKKNEKKKKFCFVFFCF